MRVLVLILLLSGCTGYQDRLRETGGQVFTELEQSSVLVLDGAIHYMCKTARVDAVTGRFNTTELRKAWATICLSSPVLPGEDNVLQPL